MGKPSLTLHHDYKLTFFLTFLLLPAFFDETYAQCSVTQSTGGNALTGNMKYGQSFATCQSGLLDVISFDITAGSGVTGTIRIYSSASGFTSELGNISSTLASGTNAIDVSALLIHVTNSTTYSFSVEASTAFGIDAASSNPYANGTALNNTGATITGTDLEFQVNIINNSAPAFAGLDATPTFVENGSNIVLDNNATVSDAQYDSENNWKGATISVVRNGGANAEDVFGFSNDATYALVGGNIQKSGNNIAAFIDFAGSLLITFSDAVATPLAADADAVLQRITYSNTNNNPPASVTLNFTVSDPLANGTGSVVVSITASNDAPSFAGLDNNPTFSEATGTPVILDGNATVSDPELDFTNDWDGASITVVRNGGANTDDIFGFSDGGGFTLAAGNIQKTGPVTIATFNTTTTPGQLVITFSNATAGVPSSGDADAVLQRITYANPSDAPPATVNLDFTVNDGTDAGTGSITVNITPDNDTPTITGLAGDVLDYTEGDGARIIEQGGNAAVQDPDLPAHLNGGSLTVSITNVVLSEDLLNIRNQGTGAGQIGFSGNTVTYENNSVGTTVGHGTSGPLVVTFTTTNATLAAVSALIQNITYENSDLGDPDNTTRTIRFVVNDGSANSANTDATVTITETNDAPEINNLAGDNLAYTEGNGTLVIEQGGNATVTDADLPVHLNGGSLTVSITSSVISEDLINIRDQGTGAGQIGFTGNTVSYENNTIGTTAGHGTSGPLVVTFTTSNATLTAVSALVRNITYENTNLSNPDVTLRTARFVVNDGFDNSSNTDATVTITGENDAPSIDNSNDVTLTTILEDATNPSGDLISTIISSLAGYIDPDGPAVARGLAITAVNSTSGTWQFTTNGGTNWNTLNPAGATSATLLASNASTRVRFVPSANFNGTVNPGMTFQAWDQTDANSNGTTGINVSAPTSTGAFSVEVETARITVTPVNDEPNFTLIASPNQTNTSSQGAVGPITIVDVVDLGPADEDIGAGPPNEQAVLDYIVSNNNNVLFTIQPDISNSRELTYTIATNAEGAATVSAQLQDDGGTANGGDDLSQVKQFTITITDDQAPVINSQVVGNQTETSFQLTVNLNENATVFWVVREGGSSTPSQNEVKTAGGTNVNAGSFSYTGGSQSTTVTGLTGLTTYDLYWIGEDLKAAQNKTAVQKLTTTTTSDITGPTITASSISSINPTSAQINITATENGTVYWVMVSDPEQPPTADNPVNESATPTADQVVAGKNASGAAALFSGSFTYSNAGASQGRLVTFITANHRYDVYIVATDAATNKSLVDKEDFTTTQIATPTNVTIIPPTPGNSAANPLVLCLGAGFVPLGDVRIEENSNGAFPIQGAVDFILTLPTGFEFNTAATVIVEDTGSGDDWVGSSPTAHTVTLTSSTVRLQYTVNEDNSDDEMWIQGLQVKATVAGASGTLQRLPGTSLGGTATVGQNTAGAGIAHAYLSVGSENVPPNSKTYDICDGDPISVAIFGSGENEANWLWYSDAALTNLIHDGVAEGVLINADLTDDTKLNLDGIVPPGSKTFYVTAAGGTGGCPSTSAVITFNINARPGASAGANRTVCNGTEITIGGFPALSSPTVTGTYTYNWTMVDGVSPIPVFSGGTLSTTPGSNPTFTPANNQTGSNVVNTYRLRIQDPKGCFSLPSDVNVTVKSAVNAPTGVTLTLNPNQNNFDRTFGNILLQVTPTAPGTPNPSVFAFSGAGISYNSVLGSYVFNTVTAGLGIHELSYRRTENGCSETVTVTVEVNELTDFDNLSSEECRNSVTKSIFPSADLIAEINSRDFGDTFNGEDWEFFSIQYANGIALAAGGGFNEFIFDPVTSFAASGGVNNTLRTIFQRTIYTSGTPSTSTGIWKFTGFNVFLPPTITFQNIADIGAGGDAGFFCTDESDLQIIPLLNGLIIGGNGDDGIYEIKLASAPATSYTSGGSSGITASGLLKLSDLTTNNYTIRYTSDISDDPDTQNLTGCSDQKEITISVFDPPAKPTLNTKFYQFQQPANTDILHFDGNDYTWVYCEGEFINSFYLEFNDSNFDQVQDVTTPDSRKFFTWYTNVGLTTKLTLTGFGSEDGRFVDRLDFFNAQGGLPPAGTYNFWVTSRLGRTPFPGGTTFVGCESEATRFTFEIIGEPDEHGIDNAPPFEGVNDIWVAEYCVGSTIEDIILDNTSALDLSDPGRDAFVWFDSDGVKEMFTTENNTVTPNELGLSSTPPVSPQIFVGTVAYNSSGFQFSPGVNVQSSPSATLSYSLNPGPTFIAGEFVTLCCSNFNILTDNGFSMTVINMEDNDILPGDIITGTLSGASARVNTYGPTTPVSGSGTVESDNLFELRLTNITGTFNVNDYIFPPQFTSIALGQVTAFTQTEATSPYTFFYARRDQIGLIPADASEGGNPGCDGDKNEVNIFVYPIPPAPSEADGPLFDVDIFSCVNDIQGTDILRTPVASNPTVEYVWYADPFKNHEIGGGLDRDNINYQLLIDDPVVNFDPSVPGTTTLYLSQITNKKNALTNTFGGCESTNLAEVTITIYDDPTEPVFTAGNGSGNNLPARTDLAADVQFSVCAGEIEAASSAGSPFQFTASGSIGTTKMDWFNSDGTGALGTQVIFGAAEPSTPTIGTLFQNQGTSAGIKNFLVRRTTNINSIEFFNGCQSPFLHVAVNIVAIPGKPSGTASYRVCQGGILGNLNAIIGDPGSTIRWYASQADIGISPVFVGTTPDADTPPVSDPEANPGAGGLGLNTATPGFFTYFVTQTSGTESINNDPDFRGCETAPANALAVTIEVRALPAVSITQGRLGFPTSTEFCISETNLTLNGSPASPPGQFTSLYGNAGITNNGNGTATLNFAQAFAAVQLAGDQDLTDRQADYEITYTYTDGFSCVNSALIAIRINQLPEPVFEVQRGNSGAEVLGGMGSTIQVCQDDLSTSSAAVNDRIVLLNNTNASIFGAMADGSFRGRITTAGLNLDISNNNLIMENVDAGIDGNNDGEAYFYPAAAIAAANVNPVLALANPITYEFDLNYRNNKGCTGNIANTSNRIVIDVYKTPVPTLDVSVPKSAANKIEVCIDYDDTNPTNPVNFTSSGVTFPGPAGGTFVYAGISLPSGTALSINALNQSGQNARFDPDVAYAQALAANDVNGSNPAIFEVSYTYSTNTPDESCSRESNIFTVTVHPLPEVEFDVDPQGQQRFLNAAALNALIDSRTVLFPLDDNDVAGTTFVPLEFCQDADPVRLVGRGFFGDDLPENLTNGTGIFTSNQGNAGIANSGAGFATFDPTSAFNLSGGAREHIVTFTFTDGATRCVNRISKTFIINSRPVITLDELGGCNGEAVEFDLNVVSLAQGDEIEFIHWDFDDGTGDDRVSTNLSEQFIYPDAPSGAEKTVKVQVYTKKGCTSVVQTSDFFIGDIPNTNFTYEGLCKDQGFVFNALPKSVNIGVVEGYTFDFNDGSELFSAFRSDFRDPVTGIVPDKIPAGAFVIPHNFPTAGIYDVQLTVETTNGCTSTHNRLVPVLPSIKVTRANPYFETFEGSAEILVIPIGTDENGETVYDTLFVDGWVPDLRLLDDRDVVPSGQIVNVARDRSEENTWQFGPVNGSFINQGANNSQNAWVTNLNGAFAENEKSWVFTPCFDISELAQPMVRFQRTYEFEDPRDGAVLQYSIDNGKNWNVLGNFNSQGSTGLNWLDTQGLQGRPGNQTVGVNLPNLVGWGGGKTSGWQEARHKLDEIPFSNAERQRVIFRFAIGSESGGVNDEGFGIDDFAIQERTKKVFVEHFSGSFTRNLSLVDAVTALERELLVESHPSSGARINENDAVFITYKTDLEGSDPINSQNPQDNSARVVFYGIERLPKTVLNGRGTVSAANVSQQQTNQPFTRNEFNKASLSDPAVNIDIELPQAAGDQIAATVHIVQRQANLNLTDPSWRLYIAVVEKTVDEESIILRNVLRKLLPNGSGIALTMNGSNVEPISQNWTISKVSDPDNLAVIAWLQSTNTKEVLQSTIVDVGDKDNDLITGLNDRIIDDQVVFIYPNPANDEVAIGFEKILEEDFKWALYNPAGMHVGNGVIERGTQQFTIRTEFYASGIYYLWIGNENKRFKHFKLFVNH